MVDRCQIAQQSPARGPLTQHAGDGKANQYFARGFNSEPAAIKKPQPAARAGWGVGTLPGPKLRPP